MGKNNGRALPKDTETDGRTRKDNAEVKRIIPG
jgi:hypothetical protein